VVNLIRPQDLSAKELTAARKGSLDRPTIATQLEAGGIEVDDALVDGLVDEARDHAERRALEDSQRKLVGKLDVPTYELPRLPQGIDLGALYELAGRLRDQGMA
jgi:hypothetical protein